MDSLTKQYQNISNAELFTVRMCKRCGAIVHYDKRYEHYVEHKALDDIIALITPKEIQDVIPF